jgi:hypothetical protein
VARQRWCNGETGAQESISGLTGARAAVWRPGDGGEEMVEEVLGVGGAWARREEKESGERCSGGWRGSPFIYGPRGRRRSVIKTEKRPVINGGGNGSI